MSLLCCKRSTGTVSNIGPNVTKPPQGDFFLKVHSLRWTSRKWKYVTHVQMAILIKMPKHIASSTVNEYKMDAFVHLRLFAFLAFSKALLNEVCRAHPDSLWCSWMSFFLSTCQIVFALSLSRHMWDREKPSWKHIWKRAFLDLASSPPLRKTPVLSADRLIWNNPITPARPETALWAAFVIIDVSVSSWPLTPVTCTHIIIPRGIAAIKATRLARPAGLIEISLSSGCYRGYLWQ